jgi:hypothetical protein
MGAVLRPREMIDMPVLGLRGLCVVALCLERLVRVEKASLSVLGTDIEYCLGATEMGRVVFGIESGYNESILSLS